MSRITPVTVTVRYQGGTYHARVGKGWNSQSASSTSCPFFAALKAAEKFLRPPAHQTIGMSPTLAENQFAETYTATLVPKPKEAA